MARLCAERPSRRSRAACRASRSCVRCAADVVLATLWYPLFRATLEGDLESALGVADTVGEVARRAMTDPDAAQAMPNAIKLLVRSVFANDAPGARIEVRLDTIAWPLPNLGHLARAGMALDLARRGERDAAADALRTRAAPLLSNLARDAYWPGVVWPSLPSATPRQPGTCRGAVPRSRSVPTLSPRHDPAGAFLGCTDHHLGLLAETSGRPDDARRHFADATEQYDRAGATWWANQLRTSAAPQPGRNVPAPVPGRRPAPSPRRGRFRRVR